MGVWRAPYLPPTPPRQQAHLPPVRMRSCLSIQIQWDPLSQLTKNQPTSPSSLEPLLGPAFIIAHLDPCGRSGAFPDSRPYIHLCFLRQPREGTCEHYSQVPSLHCSQPSRAPTSLWVKAPVLLMAHSALHDLPHPLPVLPSSPLPFAHSAPATWASSLFLRHVRYSPAPGLLHMLCPLRRRLFLPRSAFTPSLPIGLNSDVISSVNPPLGIFFLIANHHTLLVVAR